MSWYKEIKLAEYLIGTCTSCFDENGSCTCDKLPYHDVTDFAQDEENNFERARNFGIKIKYDDNTDTHYFYGMQ